MTDDGQLARICHRDLGGRRAISAPWSGHDPIRPAQARRDVSHFIKRGYECTVSVVSIPFFRCPSRGQYAVYVPCLSWTCRTLVSFGCRSTVNLWIPSWPRPTKLCFS